jgi:hypothetical protein
MTIEIVRSDVDSHASAAAAIFIDYHTPFQTASMIATSIACSRK